MPSVAEGWLAATGLPAGVRAGTVLRNAPGVSEASFGRCNLGDRCGDRPESVRRNRAHLIDWLELPGEPMWLRQVHGTEVFRPSSIDTGALPEADGAVADGRDVVLAVLTADCLPVVLAEQSGRSIGIAHAGWRGLLGGVIERTFDAMQCDGVAIRAWLGPAIGPTSFQVGPEVRNAFEQEDRRSLSAFVRDQGDRWLADLYALARQRLARCGISEISGGGMDTFADKNSCHSYRRDGAHSGRMATLVWRSCGDTPKP